MTSTPGFFDLQVNGYAGVDFNADALSVEQAARACGQLRDDGVAGFLATVITDELGRMADRIGRIVAARRGDRLVEQMVRGIHVEGPFISPQPGFVGTHPRQSVRPASIGQFEPLYDAGQGLVRLVTLAPEMDPRCAVIEWLAERGVVVSAGHCDPSQAVLERAIDHGLTMFTHLGNGCPRQLERHDNIIQRALGLGDRLWTCFIADGVHVPAAALANYLKIVGCERAIVVSDAMAAASLGPGQFTLAHQRVVVDENLATWSADRSHLMGSAVTMRQARQNLVEQVGLTAAEADRLTSTNPRRALGAE